MEELTPGEKIAKGMSIMAEGLAETLIEFGKTFSKMWDDVKPHILPLIELQNKTMTKNKFRGMLQASGLQRNEINIIVSNNKEPYTYKRLSEVINLYENNR